MPTPSIATLAPVDVVGAGRRQPNPLLSPDQFAVADFEKAYKKSAAAPVPPPPTVSAPAAAGSEMSLGDRILGGLNGLSQQSVEINQMVADTGTDMTVADAANLFVKMNKFKFDTELMGKGVSLVVKAADQLSKVQ